ncbi:helix-turn-helix transcriptional regulator [Streptomyces rochei]|uniref:helix-turn-helix transcriptional regulator n=1 Tax=Streptomyces rochei TaxID=1928 RepID=UPI00379FBEE2
MGRPQRLIELLAALQAHPRTTAEALAGELGVSTRTVLRDVRALVDAGIPVFTERGKYGGISLLPGNQADMSKLTTGEADLLRAVGLDPDRARRVGGEAAARSALRKLTPRRSPPPARDDLPLSLTDVIAIDNRPWFGEAAPPARRRGAGAGRAHGEAAAHRIPAQRRGVRRGVRGRSLRAGGAGRPVVPRRRP